MRGFIAHATRGPSLVLGRSITSAKTNDLIHSLSLRPITPVSLKQLIDFGTPKAMSAEEVRCPFFPLFSFFPFFPKDCRAFVQVFARRDARSVGAHDPGV